MAAFSSKYNIKEEEVAQLNNYYIKFDLKYEPTLAGDEYEKPSRIAIYPSYDFLKPNTSNPCVLFCKNQKNSEGFHFENQTLEMQSPLVYIPTHIQLNFEAYAKFKNDCNEWCINQAGFFQFKLRKYLLRTGIGKQVSFELTVPRSQKAEKKVKGIVYFTVLETNLPFKTKPPKDFYAKVDATTKIKEYIEENQDFYLRHPPVDMSFNTVRVFCFFTKSGLIPGSLYNLFPIPKSQEEYYLNSLQVIMKRRYPNGQQEYLMLPTMEEKLDVIMAMLHLYVNYCPYITDLVDNNDADRPHDSRRCELFDSFDDMRSRGCGDCEDGTCEIHKQVAEIKFNKNDFISQTMIDVRAVLNMFVFVSALCVVDNKSISETAHGSQNNGRPQAHECAMAIPNYIFFKALKQSGVSRDLLKKYSKVERNYASTSPIFILEGTGNLIARPQIKQAHIKKIGKQLESVAPDLMDRLADVAVCQFFFDPHSRGFFYDILVALITPEFYFRHEYPVFEFLVCNKEGERGVRFSEFVEIEHHKEIQLLAAPKISKTVIDLSMRIRNNEYPPITLEAPLPVEEIKSKYLKFRDLMNQNSTEQDYYDAIQKYKHLYSFQLRFSDATEEMVLKIIQAVKAAHLKIYSFIELIRSLKNEKKMIGGFNIAIFS
jgi:hypothetical protein